MPKLLKIILIIISIIFILIFAAVGYLIFSFKTFDWNLTTKSEKSNPLSSKIYPLKELNIQDGNYVVLIDDGILGGTGKIILKDQELLKSLQDKVFYKDISGLGDAVGSFSFAIMGAPPIRSFMIIYKDDIEVKKESCYFTNCQKFLQKSKNNLNLLIDAGHRYPKIDEEFTDYENYKKKYDEIKNNPNYVFLGMPSKEQQARQKSSRKIYMPLLNVSNDFDIESYVENKSKITQNILNESDLDLKLKSVDVKKTTPMLYNKKENKVVIDNGLQTRIENVISYSIVITIEGSRDDIQGPIEKLDLSALKKSEDLKSVQDELLRKFLINRHLEADFEIYQYYVDIDFKEEPTVSWFSSLETYFLSYYDLSK